MLKTAPLITVVPGVDLERARRFYRDTLGLTPVLDNADPTTILFEAGNGSRIAIYERGQTKADHTIGAFIVEDIEGEVAWLASRGVQMEQYDFPGLKTNAQGIADMPGGIRSAWFLDSEGNILAMDQWA